MPPARKPSAKRKAADAPEPMLPRDALVKHKQRKRFVWSEHLHSDFIAAGVRTINCTCISSLKGVFKAYTGVREYSSKQYKLHSNVLAL